MVTLLLIPSVLVSGTAVDSARIYAARSVVQDANQLASNSVLASYDALLQDLYGLYGIMGSDEELAEMIDQYIEIAIFGQKSRDQGLGTFQLTYGSDLQPGSVTAVRGQNLGNTEVLRRQIEEYAKFRAPVILVDQILDKLDGFKKIKKDADVIQQKMDIDKDIEKLGKTYQELYDLIQEIDRCPQEEQEIVRTVNNKFGEINSQLRRLSELRDRYEHEDEVDENLQDDYDRYYSGVCGNVKALLQGGTVRSNWHWGYYEESETEDEEDEWVPGRFRDSETVRLPLEKHLDNSIKRIQDHQDKLNELVDKCQQADKEKEELRGKVDELERKMNEDGGCSEELRKTMEDPTVEVGPAASGDNRTISQLDYYRSLLKYDVTSMGTAMRGQDAPQLQSMLELLDKETLTYGDHSGLPGDPSPQITLSELMRISHSEEFSLDGPEEPLESLAYLGASLYNIKVPNTPTSFEIFRSTAFDGTKNREFYEVLEKLWGVSGEGPQKKKEAKNAVTKIFGEAQKVFKGITDYEPAGAWKYQPHTGAGGIPGEDMPQTDFGSKGDWEQEDEGRDKTKEALNSNIVTRLGDIGDGIVNKGLLLVYDSEMFSDFTTKEDGSQKSMAGIPMSVDVNYYFQSELEYLYAGDLYDAKANLRTVSGMIFLVRFVFDYIASFRINEVNMIVGQVKAALAFSGPFAFVMGELTRVGLSLGEAALDVGRLRSGHEVALIKTNKTWKFSLDGLVDMAGETLSAGFTQKTANTEESDVLDDDGISLDYKNYLQIFLLFVSDTAMAERTQNLIQLNLTNKRNNIGSKGDHTTREAAMTAVELEELSRAITGFSITTTLDLRMLFLSMPIAQQGINGRVPPGTMQLSVTDHRGY